MNPAVRRTGLALALQGAALALLALALAGVGWLDARSRPRVAVLVDRSASVPRAAADPVLAQALRDAGGAEVRVIEFAGRPAPAASAAGDAAALDPASTDIEAALDAVLAADADDPFDRVLVVSDGHASAGDTERALRAVHEAGLPLRWLAVGGSAPATRIAEVLAPAQARVGQPLQVTVQLAGQLTPPPRIRVTLRAPTGEAQSARADADADGRATVELDARAPGAQVVDVAIDDAAGGPRLDALADAAVVDVAAPAALLYAQGGSGTLAQSLRRGGWALDVVPAARLDARAQGLDAYRAVVLDDVAVADASPRFWNALEVAVRERGLGLLVLGGERAFARGGYRGAVLESLLPLLSQPAALAQPLAVVFAVDKSGSMGQGSGGVDRFQLAQRAVLESARDLGERDMLGLLVFDVAPRVLIPLGPAGAASAALARAWPVSPNGGTQLAPALEAAIAELERAGGARRLLVLVTDGYVDDAPLALLRERLARARVETIALAVGPDADAAALQRLFGAAALVRHVDQAAELPQAMRAGLDQRRARIERGTIAVHQRQPLPFAPGVLAGWPAVDAYAVTQARDEAAVALESERGDALLATWQVGRGRVLALASGIGPWTAPWLRWREWPRLAGGMAAWVEGRGGALALRVSPQPGGLRVDAEPTGGAAAATPVTVSVDTPTGAGRGLAFETVAPGRLRAWLPDGPAGAAAGLYTFVVATPQGTQRQVYLRRSRSERETWGINPQLDAWRRAGLIDAAPASPRRERAPRAPDRSLVALALLLSLAGIAVDRSGLGGGGLREALRRRLRRGT